MVCLHTETLLQDICATRILHTPEVFLQNTDGFLKPYSDEWDRHIINLPYVNLPLYSIKLSQSRNKFFPLTLKCTPGLTRYWTAWPFFSPYKIAHDIFRLCSKQKSLTWGIPSQTVSRKLHKLYILSAVVSILVVQNVFHSKAIIKSFAHLALFLLLFFIKCKVGYMLSLFCFIFFFY